MFYFPKFCIIFVLFSYLYDVIAISFNVPANIINYRLSLFDDQRGLRQALKCSFYNISKIAVQLKKKKSNQNIKSILNFVNAGKLKQKDIASSSIYSLDKTLNIIGGANNKKKILILISNTGGGHRASAQALDRAISDAYKNKFDVDILDIWTDHAKWPFNKFVPVYRILAAKPILWRCFYAYGMFPPTKLFTEVCSKVSCYDSFRKAIVASNPDMVVSVHPLCQLIPISVVAEMNKNRDKSNKIPFVTIVTDLGGAHPTWFDKRVDHLFVPSEAVKKIAIKNGVPKQKINLRGLPVRPAFWKDSTTKDQLRSKLGLMSKVTTILIMGGGDGVGSLYPITCAIASKLCRLNEHLQLIAVCGHNKQAASKLLAKIWPNNIKVNVKGFVENIDEYMGASDCLVTKAGPGTIAEAMIRGLPIVLSSFLPGQVSY